MQVSHFSRLVGALHRLTATQLGELKQRVGKQGELKEFKALVWQRHQTLGVGTTASGQARLCRCACHKTFTSLTGTGFERLRVSPGWLSITKT